MLKLYLLYAWITSRIKQLVYRYDYMNTCMIWKNNICLNFISEYDDEFLRVDNLKDKVGTYGKLGRRI